MPTNEDPPTNEQFGTVTRILAGHCHKCAICPHADTIIKKLTLIVNSFPEKIWFFIISSFHSSCLIAIKGIR